MNINIRRSMLDVRVFSLFRAGGVSPKRRLWPQASSLIGKETLMLFVQPQRRQGTKIKIHIIPLCLRTLVAQL